MYLIYFLDFNIATQKRVVFVGELICIGCQQPKTHCECSSSGGMCHKCGKIFSKFKWIFLNYNKKKVELQDEFD